MKMENKDGLKEIDIKNRTCCYFDDIMRVTDIDFSHILLSKRSNKTYGKKLFYVLSYQIFMGPKQLLISFDKIDRFIKIHDGIRYLVLFGSRLYDVNHNKIRYLVNDKSGITDSISHNYIVIGKESRIGIECKNRN